jgi:ribosomal-protein-alanine N-acetyltransferase
MVAINPLDPRSEGVKKTDDDHNFGHRLLQIKHLFDHDRFFGEEKTSSTTDYLVGIAGSWTMLDEAHIITIATRGNCRRQGIGELLLISVIDMVTQLKSNIVTLEVRVSNTPAQALYEKYSFRKVGLRRRYYSDNGEDAFIMTVEDITSASFQSLFQQLKEAHRKERADLYA